MTTERCYLSIRQFYAAKVTRSTSPEWDFGVHWVADTDRSWPTWRVSWIVETGEVYAVELATERVLVLGVVPKVGDYPYGRSHEAWQTFSDAQPIERLMDGWADEPHRPLDWVRERIRSQEPELARTLVSDHSALD